MVFWVLAALLTFGASLAVMRPFFRGGNPTATGSEHDLAVYQDQLSELEQEVGRGLISAADAAEARAEIGRRILRLKKAEAAGDEQAARRRRLAGAIAFAAVLAVPLVSWSLYSVLGSPGLQSAPLAARLSGDPAQASLGELIARAEQHLSANPDDLRGWETLAPIYSRLGRYADAAAAYRRTIELAGATSEREAALGEALVGESGGLVTAQAEGSFERALALDGENPRARFFIAMARAQEGQNEEARWEWESMVEELPEDSPWKSAASRALASLSERERQAPSGPTDEEISAAGNMAPEMRQDMIEGMVLSLDARLRENPADLEGWQRLLQSYVVLGHRDAAEEALARALAALGRESAEAEELAQFATTLGLSEERR